MEGAHSTRMTAAARREQLLDVTKTLVSERGFHGVSIEGVARDAGISRPIVYGHFSDLQGLFEALVDREGARALDQLEHVLPTDLASGDPRDVLFLSLRSYLEAVLADPDTWRLVLMPPEGAPQALHAQITEGRDAVVAQLAVALGGGFAPARKPPDPELTARMLSTMADEAARLVLTRPDRYPLARVLEHTRWVLDQLPD